MLFALKDAKQGIKSIILPLITVKKAKACHRRDIFGYFMVKLCLKSTKIFANEENLGGGQMIVWPPQFDIGGGAWPHGPPLGTPMPGG